MQIQKVTIENFRSFKKDFFILYPYLVFVGKNNSGKSNLMRALDVFYSNKPTFDDFRKTESNTATRFRITVQASNLSPGELKLYTNKLIRNEPATILIRYTVSRKENSSKLSTKYEYFTRAVDFESPDLDPKYQFLVESKTSVKIINEDNSIPESFKEYVVTYLKELDKKRLAEKDWFPLTQSYANLEPMLKKIKRKNFSDELKITSSNIRQYFGYYFFIPAVQDIEKETSYGATAKTNLNKLMHYILEKTTDRSKKQDIQEQINTLLQEYYDIKSEDSEMVALQNNLNQILNDFDGSNVRFDTKLPAIDKIVRDSLQIFLDDGVETAVHDKGHGLQRYFMIALFKAWADCITKDQSCDDGNTTVVFAIEEPELFLHPQYQRLMQAYLRKISDMPHNQVILNTHSPNFINFGNYLEIARVVKDEIQGDLESRILQPIEIDNGRVRKKELIHTHGKEKEKYRSINKLNIEYYMDPNRNELFFADKIVLVEGQTEKIMFRLWAEYFFPDDLERLNTTSYIDMNGKFNAQLFEEMLNGFEIPYVIIIDDDRDSGDSTMNTLNIHIQKAAKKGLGSYIELEGDFEAQFDITGHEMKRSGDKKNKPWVAYRKFFRDDSSPKTEELEKLRNFPKLNEIFKVIYGKSLND